MLVFVKLTWFSRDIMTPELWLIILASSLHKRSNSSAVNSTQRPLALPLQKRHHPSTPLSSFSPLAEEDIKCLFGKSSKKSCSLDPISTLLVVECLDVLLPVVSRMINLSLKTGSFPDTWKHAEVRPRLKKPNSEATFTNLCPTSDLPKLTAVSRLCFCKCMTTWVHATFIL